MSVDQMIELYRGGCGLLDLEIRTGLARAKVRDTLVAAGVEIRRRGGVRGGCGGQKFRTTDFCNGTSRQGLTMTRESRMVGGIRRGQ